MRTVQTKTISQVRNQLSNIAEEGTITAITRNGHFVGVLLTGNFSTTTLATLTHKRLKDNPVHTITELTKQVLQ
jgi:uncharacterized membrane protein YiaA